MNPTGNSSPLASLMMSLGGSIDLKSLELTSDGALPLSDFSSVLADYTLGGTQDGGLSAAFSGLPDGEGLPQLLPEGKGVALADFGDTRGTQLDPASNDSTELALNDMAHVMAQIENPVNVAIRYAKGDGGRLEKDHADLRDDLIADASLVAATAISVEKPSPVESAIGITEPQLSAHAQANAVANARVATMADSSRAGSHRSESLSAAMENVEIPADAELASDVFRPVTATEDGDSPFLNRDNMPSAQSSLIQNAQMANVQSQAGNAPATVAAALTTAVESGADTSSDSFSIAEASDEFQDHRLERQMKDRLEFGQDRREWSPALGARLMTMVADDVQQARIQLDPPELGSLEIKLHVSQDQASVQVTAQSSQVKDVLDSGAKALRDALAAEGIELAEFSVGTDSGRSGGGESGDGQRGDSFAGDSDAGFDAESADTVALNRRASDALLDTFA